MIGSRYRRLPSGSTRVSPLSLGVLTSFNKTGFCGCKTSSEVVDDMAAIEDIIEDCWDRNVSERSFFLDVMCRQVCSESQVKYDAAE